MKNEIGRKWSLFIVMDNLDSCLERYGKTMKYFQKIWPLDVIPVTEPAY
jgi:hypothetical protein